MHSIIQSFNSKHSPPILFVVVLNVLGSLHVLPHQLHGDHPQRVHLPHTHSGSVEASFETQLVSKIHIKTNIFEGEKIMSVPRYIMINDPLLAIDLTVSRCKKLLLLGYSESPIFFKQNCLVLSLIHYFFASFAQLVHLFDSYQIIPIWPFSSSSGLDNSKCCQFFGNNLCLHKEQQVIIVILDVIFHVMSESS